MTDELPAAPSWRRRLFEVVTVGLPFSTFKLVVGVHLSGTTAVGFALVGLGIIDLAMNLANAAGLVIMGRSHGPLCLLHGLVRRLRFATASGRLDELGLAIDAALALVLVAGMIAAGRLAQLPSTSMALWNAAVILNVMGAGALRLVDAARAALRDQEARRSDGTTPGSIGHQ